jgi:hypothetical protein
VLLAALEDSTPPRLSPKSDLVTPFAYLHEQMAAALPQPAQTPFLISLPHFLHGAQPQTWHIANPLPSK